MTLTPAASFTADEVGDGMPLFAPTRERVAHLLEFVPQSGETVIGEVPPANGTLTYSVAAANAAMTGCTPPEFWLVTEVLAAVLGGEFNLLSIQATTHPAGPVILVSGPVAAQLGVHGGSGCMGPGWPVNARVGRAVRLALMNVGGARPGGLDMATFGGPAKWSLCFSDQPVDVEANRWPTLAEEQTGSPDTSTVTVIGGEGPLNVNDHFSTRATGLLRMIAHTLATVGSNHAHNPRSTPMVVIGAEHAAVIAGDGFTRDDARAFIARHARIPLSQWSKEARDGRLRNRYPKLYGDADDQDEVAVVAPEDLVLAVAGGPGKHSVVIPSFGRSVSVREIRLPA
ncbi:MAG: hypothetical protein QM626_13730 [Microbacterium sp.]|uniref:hypothetical protein n=1 Tax=Microbacterium sp. TaxID=51671 RepID=UPI0039E6E1F9